MHYRTCMTDREAIQLVKDFTAERACNEVEFYMGMIADDKQTFDCLIYHLKNVFQSGETMSQVPVLYMYSDIFQP